MRGLARSNSPSISVTPTPASSNVPERLFASSRLISAASSAISNARSPTMIFSTPSSRGRSILPAGCANRSAAPKVYSLHAPEVECIGKGKPHKPYEFGVKVSVATTRKRCKGGQFAIHAQALPGNPYDGHTLARVIPAIEQLVGNTIERIHTDAGYRGHNAPPDYKFKVYTSKQKRGVTPQIQREMRRRATIEPVIGHTKHEYRMDRNYLAHRHGDANNAILAAAGYNFSLLLRWLRFLLRPLLALLGAAPKLAAA